MYKSVYNLHLSTHLPTASFNIYPRLGLSQAKGLIKKIAEILQRSLQNNFQTIQSAQPMFAEPSHLTNSTVPNQLHFENKISSGKTEQREFR